MASSLNKDKKNIRKSTVSRLKYSSSSFVWTLNMNYVLSFRDILMSSIRVFISNELWYFTNISASCSLSVLISSQIAMEISSEPFNAKMFHIKVYVNKIPLLKFKYTYRILHGRSYAISSKNHSAWYCMAFYCNTYIYIHIYINDHLRGNCVVFPFLQCHFTRSLCMYEALLSLFLKLILCYEVGYFQIGTMKEHNME